MRARSTGVEIIDELMGGIMPGLPCVLAGPSGSGRTVVALQLAAAAVEQGRVVTLLCNEPASLLLRQASSLGLRLDRALESERLALLEMDAEIAAVTSALGGEALFESLRAEQPLCSMLIVDPLSVITAGIFDETQLRAVARSLVAGAGDWLTVLTVESERLALQQGLERILGEICGSFLTLSRDEDGVRWLGVEKTRTTVPRRDSVAFAIGQGGTRFVDPPPAAATTEPPRSGQTNAPVEAVPSRTDAAPAGAAAGADAPLDGRDVIAPASPSGPAAVRSAPLERTRPAEPPGRPVVLVVDGDRESRERLVKWLEGPYEVAVTEDGFEAMTWLMTRQPDLVILDLVMPRVTGFELLGALQRSGVTVPRLVISNRVERAADRLAPLVLGATDILQKPVDRIELGRKVEILLHLESPPADLIDPQEASDLFARVSATRLLSRADFHARLDRSAHLGERLSLPSSIVLVAAPSGDALDHFLEAADHALRFEDATLRVSPRRAVVLLVATACEDAPVAVERLCAVYGDKGGRTDQISMQVRPAQRVTADFDWHALFRGEPAARPAGSAADRGGAPAREAGEEEPA